ncbi:hypothetical protein [Actinoplanes cyaneus]|uniref:hypothetical protein n=1 Tax=Actinoplanes cyaneus TaxID=52696 RepID=UPI0019449144|nr:hypothetical protein [Actinoplanes cyaneus]MCW2136403.1 hypothetical protein [Actinoplanes cyaneus]
MTTTAHRTSVFRSLPALLALLLAFFAAPASPAGFAPVAHSASVSAAAAVSSASATSAAPAATQAPAPAEVTARPVEPVSGSPVTDRTRVEFAQRSAGVTGSRAPPRTAA